MGWLIGLLRSIAVTILPQIVQDAWERRNKEEKKEPPVTEPEKVDPPATDSGSPPVAGGSKDDDDDGKGSEPDKSDPVKVDVANDPKNGKYLIEEDSMNESGVGRVVGKAWLRRPWPNAGGGAYYYVTRTQDDKHGYVQWTPHIREDGEYDVFVRYAATLNRTSAAVYVVKADGKTASVRINQRGTSETKMVWKKLGRFPFVKGKSGFVRLLNSQGHSECADSLALNKV